MRQCSDNDKKLNAEGQFNLFSINMAVFFGVGFVAASRCVVRLLSFLHENCVYVGDTGKNRAGTYSQTKLAELMQVHTYESETAQLTCAEAHQAQQQKNRGFIHGCH